MPKPRLECKRKLADAATDELPEPDQARTKLRKKIEQTMTQSDESTRTSKVGGHHAKVPKETPESCVVDEREDTYPTILPNFYQLSVTSPRRSLRLQTNLCVRCANIDLDDLLSRPHKTQAGQPEKNLSPVPKWKKDSCPLCNLLSSTIDQQYWPSGKKVSLRTYSSNKMGDKAWNSISTNLLQAGHGRRYIVSQPQGMKGPVRIIKAEIDRACFETVKGWISFCQNKHTKVCSIEDRSFIPGLKLIDCLTGDIILAENKLYVALSYVWGAGSEGSEHLSKLPETMPNTINDAITVTKELGFRYLWVDRYCIDQKNEQEKIDQCGRMDVIYQNAELTIIAAIGEDPNYGLPGVSQRKRKPQHLTTCTKIGKHFLISTDAWPKDTIKETKWKSRAWTYQEGLLSRRRLVFAEEQMYFECYGMYCCESVHFPLESMHRKDMQGFKRDFCSDKMVGMFPKGVGITSPEIVWRIEEYSGLDLTNPSDILKGILGIFNTFRRGRLGIDHCLGIPILPSIVQRGKPTEELTPSMGFFCGLLWNTSWKTEKRPERRKGFPSWSWTGWYGPVQWSWFSGLTWSEVKIDPGVQLSVELSDGQILRWETFQEIGSKQNMLSRLSNIIHVAAWTIEIPIIKRGQVGDKDDKDEYTARLRLEDGGHLEWRFESISKIKFRPGQVCKGIILGHDRSGWATGPFILVLGKINDTMERIGLGLIDQFFYKRWDRNGVWEFADEEEPLAWGNPKHLEPLELVKSWEEIRFG